MILSHSNVYGKRLKCLTINWVPDFQVLHFPELWSIKDKRKWIKLIENMIHYSDIILLSSHDAYNDFKSFALKETKKARVLHFVSQVNEKIFNLASDEFQQIFEKKYDFKGRYFFLPNQFWKHKNHEVVFKAVNLLKKKGIEILVICSGPMQDYRSHDSRHINELVKYIKDNGLQSNIKILGMIDYLDVLKMMKCSIAIINPSFFEGWSSTVEEAKSIGKCLVLSRLNVHIEQNPPDAYYFDPYDEKELSEILQKKWMDKSNGNSDTMEKARNDLKKRTRIFAENYQQIVLELIRSNIKGSHLYNTKMKTNISNNY